MSFTGEDSTGSRHVQPPTQSSVSTTNTSPPQADVNTGEAVDAKKLEKLKKLEAWKKKQAERKKQKELEAKQEKSKTPTPVAPKPTILPKTTTTTKQKLGFKKPVVKNVNVFGSILDEDQTKVVKRQKFIPTADIGAEDDQPMADAPGDEEDPLEAYMKQLEGEDLEDIKPTEADGPSLIEEADAPPDDNDDDDADNIDENTEATQLLKRLRSKKSKDIQAPKYNVKELEPFPKNFLVERDDIDADEVLNFRVLNDIFINNKKINPIFNFYHFGLDATTLNILINELRFVSPTPIQSQTIPAIMSGKDVIGVGKTGSGKTMCYLLSMLKHIMQQRPLSDNETGPMGLILSPTRELAIQIHEACQMFMKPSGLRSICCTGGSELKNQISDIKRGVHLIIATPGRFIDLLTLNNGRLLKTDRITFVTLDEADRLFDLGFEPQVNQIMKTIRPDKQCVLFSATFPPKLHAFAVKILRKPTIISVGNKQDVNENITQQAKIFTTEDEKFNHLLHLLGKQTTQKTIIFCDSQLQVNFMNRRLLSKGYEPVCIHAGLPSHERTANLQLFKKSTTSNILVCTEVLSRGLDVPEVSLVILYNAAKTFAQYVHTTGRTARGNTKGTAITLLDQNEDAQAYILYKFMPEEHIPEDVKALALVFEKDLKSGKRKMVTGFGGKGLDNLDKLRDEHEKNERKQYNEGDEEKKNDGDSDEEDDDNEAELKGPNLEIEYNVKKDTVDGGVFNAKINMNDLPQDVRWVATNNVVMAKVIEQTSVACTFRGRFYPEGQEPKEGDEPKLYLLVEADKEQQVHEAIEIFKSLVIQGLKKATQDRSGKFSM